MRTRRKAPGGARGFAAGLLCGLLLGPGSSALAGAPCGPVVLNPVEQVVLLGQPHLRVAARVDTGTDISSLDSGLAEQFGLDRPVLREVVVHSANGITRRRVVRLKFMLRGQMRTGEFTLVQREGLGHKVLLGLSGIKGFLVDPAGPCKGC